MEVYLYIDSVIIIVKLKPFERTLTIYLNTYEKLQKTQNSVRKYLAFFF